MASLLAASNPDFSGKFDITKASSLFLTILAWLAAEIFTDYANAPKNKEHDEALYAKFLELFSPGVVEFLELHDFGGSYRPERLKSVHSFVREWRVPNFQFQNTALNAAFKKCYSSAVEFSEYAAWHTGPHHSNAMLQTAAVYNSNTGELTEESIEEIKNLNDLSTKLHKTIVELQQAAHKAGLSAFT